MKGQEGNISSLKKGYEKYIYSGQLKMRMTLNVWKKKLEIIIS